MILLAVVLTIQNPAIDMPGYLAVAKEAAVYRESRRVSEEEFIRMSGEPDTIILDARSRAKFDELHIRGAINLSFPDITVDSLPQTTVMSGKLRLMAPRMCSSSNFARLRASRMIVSGNNNF